MKKFRVMMLNLQILLLVMLLGHAKSDHYIHVHTPDRIPDPHFPAIRRDVSKLTKFIIANFTEETFIVCVLHCLGNRFCVAVNYKEKAVGNEPNCQLTNTTEQVFDESASNKDKVWTFQEVTVDRTLLDCPGEVNECKNGGTMIWDPVKPFTCKCSEGFEGERCENVLSHYKECFRYIWLTDSKRNKKYSSSSNYNCDIGLSGWYRFGGGAGTKLATTCVPFNRCGTAYTGWMNGAHPTVADGKVTRKVCFRSSRNCCYAFNNIEVVDCGQYYVYKLSPPSGGCSDGYCGSDN